MLASVRAMPASRRRVWEVRALVVYESMFGNTRDVAQAVADGIGTAMAVDLVEVSKAPTSIPADVALLVVGGPTHAHGMTKPESREDSARRAGDRLVSHGIGVREWLERLAPPTGTIGAAAFDTRIKGPRLLWGSAAEAVGKRLRALGFREIASPEDFLVGGPTGPMFDRLIPGEVERAGAWGARLGAEVAARTAPVG
jgi:hypothetical protein